MARIANTITVEEWRRLAGGKRAPHQHHVNGVMNRNEAAYAAELEFQRLAGAVRAYAYEPEKLRLALRTFLTPDFRVVLSDGSVEWHEVKPRKGRSRRFYAREDAWIKLKVAADRYPEQRFYVVWRVDGVWMRELVPGGSG